MLLHAGLDDIVNVRPGAQIAFLLVERARLLDMLEESQNEYSPDGTVQTPRGTNFNRQPGVRQRHQNEVCLDSVRMN